MIIIAIGSNLSKQGTSCLDICLKALSMLNENGVSIKQISNWYRTEPVPVSEQPWFYNAVAEVETDLFPRDLLAVLHKVEAELGRVRNITNEARPIDLDLIDYNGVVCEGDLNLPHPRMHDRAFVLLPIKDIALNWSHPISNKNVLELIKTIPPEQKIMTLSDYSDRFASK